MGCIHRWASLLFFSQDRYLDSATKKFRVRSATWTPLQKNLGSGPLLRLRYKKISSQVRYFDSATKQFRVRSATWTPLQKNFESGPLLRLRYKKILSQVRYFDSATLKFRVDPLLRYVAD
jgi:hypothetical protein